MNHTAASVEDGAEQTGEEPTAAKGEKDKVERLPEKDPGIEGPHSSPKCPITVAIAACTA